MEAEGGDDMAKAEAFLQMTTAKLTKARAPSRVLSVLPLLTIGSACKTAAASQANVLQCRQGQDVTPCCADRQDAM